MADINSQRYHMFIASKLIYIAVTPDLLSSFVFYFPATICQFCMLCNVFFLTRERIINLGIHLRRKDPSINKIRLEVAYHNGIYFHTVSYKIKWRFYNAKGTTFYSMTKGFSSWIQKFKDLAYKWPQRCQSCLRKAKLCGGHMVREDQVGTRIYHIIPICQKCNNHHNDNKTVVIFPAGYVALMAIPTWNKEADKKKYLLFK